MNTTKIRKSNTSKTGYELIIIDENGNEKILPIDNQPKNEPNTLILPENPSNRKYFNTKKVDNNNGEIELTYKETIKIGTTTKSTSTKSLEDYLSDDDKKTYLELVEKAKKAKELATTKTPEQKLREKIEKLQAELKAIKTQSK